MLGTAPSIHVKRRSIELSEPVCCFTMRPVQTVQTASQDHMLFAMKDSYLLGYEAALMPLPIASLWYADQHTGSEITSRKGRKRQNLWIENHNER